MSKFNIEFRKFTNDDFSFKPACFKDEFAGQATVLIRHDQCGMILFENELPHYYFHNMNQGSSRWSGFIELGNHPFALQKGVPNTDTSQDEPMSAYGIECNDPLTYGLHTLNGIEAKFTYNEDGCEFIEGKDGEILHVKGEWFPYGLICHLGSEYNIPFMHLPVLLKGTYRGKTVEFLACIDRIFSPEGQENNVLKNATSYISSYCSGIRANGLREWFIGLICHKNGKGLGIYWLEGEDPIISDEVVNEGIWEKLPYVDDGTAVCVDNIWKFGGKEIHVIGKWGAKGFTAKPRLDRHGQSQMFGTWYEGTVPYQHRIWNTFNENMEAYVDSMKERGFKVKDTNQ